MALGAYTAAILTVRYGIHWLPAIVAGGLIAVLVAWMIGMPTLRLTGDYYANKPYYFCDVNRSESRRPLSVWESSCPSLYVL